MYSFFYLINTNGINFTIEETIMTSYNIFVSEELNQLIISGAKRENISPEVFINRILNRYAMETHNIDIEGMAEGYREMAAINLELAK